jgi:UDP-N-acetylglucosamine--N-acetylmuramyl-(pentapeptide) pyrophosphoryl-undecaprenol N-acetylglucosamine transferase
MPNPNEPIRIVVAGGGSGGHVYPVLAVLEALEKRFAELDVPLQVTRIGPRDGYEVLFQNHGVVVSTIVGAKLRRYFSLANFVDGPKFLVALLQALFKLYFIMPDVIFSKGGTSALPVVAAGWFYRIPVVIHESDSRPGLTNLASAHFAKKVFISFAAAASYFKSKKTEVVGTPVRGELFSDRTTKNLAKETLGFSPSDPLMLVLGGSQGSRRINEFILENLSALLKDTQILHQTGIPNLAEAQKLSRAAIIDESFKNRYQPVGYFENNLSMALTAPDLVIARAGSNTIAELAAFGLPAILIPLTESANDHQRVNAYEFAKAGAAVVIEETNLLPGIFLAQVKAVLSDENLRSKMSDASAKFFTPGAAEKIAQTLINIALRREQSG